MNARNLAVVPVILLVVSIFVAVFFDLSELFIFNPPYLLLALNLLFWTGATVAIAFFSAKSFLREGSLTILLLSTSIIIFGISVIVSAWIGNFSGNLSVAVSNPCLLVASMLQVQSGILYYKGSQETNISSRKGLLTVAYLSSVIFVAVYSMLVFLVPIPAFFTASGPTVLRQIILGSAAALFAIAALVFGAQYAKSKSPSLFWYALAIVLLSVGLFSAFEVKTLGDVPTWLGRATLYLGTTYLMAALLASKRKAGDSDLASAWSNAFMSDRGQIATLFSKMLNGFSYHRIIVDDHGKPVDYVFLAANEAFERMTGLKRGEVIGKRATEVLPGIENDPSDWINVYGKVALSGIPVAFERYAEVLKRWYSVSAYSPKKGDFVAIFEDVTERKKAEKVISDLAKFPLENPAVVFRVDKTGVIMFANPAASSFLLEWQTEVGKNIPEHVRKNVIDALASNGKFEFEANLGEETFSFLVVPIAAEGYANLYGRNVSKRKRAEKKLEEYARNLESLVAERTKKLETSALYARSLIEASLDPLVTISVEGKITDVNRATELVTGCSREELIESDFSDFFTEPEKAKTGYKQVFTKGFVIDFPLAIRHKSGKTTEVLYNASVYRNAEGQVQGVFAAARDVTERKKLERKLQESERLATIGATAGMVGHDIRNPLQAISGDVYLIKSDLSAIPEGEEKESIKESLAGLEKNVMYIDKIVQDLQDYARPIKPNAEEFEIEVLCKDILLKSGIPKNIEASCKVERRVKSIVSDPHVLRRILSNLVNNAVQAMPDGGRMDLHLHQKAKDTVITVSDTGVGIPEEIKPRIFTPLFTTKSKGQGFGLAVVKRMTEALGGTITFESEEGKGTKFILRFPTLKKKIDGD